MTHRTLMQRPDPLDVHVMSDNAQAQLAAKDARIAELEAVLQYLYDACIDPMPNTDLYFLALEKTEETLGMKATE